MYNIFLQLLRNNNVQEFVILLVENENFNLEDSDEEGRTLLHWALIENNLDITRVLLAAGASLMTESDEEKNALYYITQLVNPQLYFEMVAEVADFYETNSQEHPQYSPHLSSARALHRAAAHGSAETVRILLEQYPGILNGIALAANDALLISAELGHLPIVQYLLNNQWALIDAQNADGENALMLAILGGHYSTVRFLLENLSTFLAWAGQGNNPLELLGRTNRFDEGPLDCIIASEVLANNPESYTQMVKLLINCYAQIVTKEELVDWLVLLFRRGFLENLLPTAAIEHLFDICPSLINQIPTVNGQPLNQHHNAQTFHSVHQITWQLQQLNLNAPPTESSGEHLYIVAPPGRRFIVSMAPVNGTGDIYHIISYLILARSYNKEVPIVVLTYDGSTTLQTNENSMNAYSQALRAYAFAQQLGYGEYFVPPLAIPVNGTNPTNRQDSLIQKLRSQYQSRYYIDQLALTGLISHHFARHGKSETTRRLHAGFMRTNMPQNIVTIINTKVQQDIARITTAIGNRPLLILQVRNSSNATQMQNFDEDVLLRLKDYLEANHYAIWFIFTDGRKSNSFKSIKSNRMSPFPFIVSNNNVDYGKIFHLRLLSALLNLHQLIGILGNTSGTLDAAALIGHRVYNLHVFNNGIDYLGYRILIQSSFLSIQQWEAERAGRSQNSVPLILNDLRTARGTLGDLTEAIFNRYFPFLRQWLASRSSVLYFHSPRFSHVGSININPSLWGYKQIFYYESLSLPSQIFPIMGNVTTLQGYVQNRIANAPHQALFQELLACIQNLNSTVFNQQLNEYITSRRFDVNLRDEEYHQTLLHWALDIIAKQIINYQSRTHLLIMIHTLLNNGASLTVQSGSENNAFHYLWRINDKKLPAQANSLRLQLLDLFVRYYHAQTASPIQFSGYNITDKIAADGNCLFHAISHQLQMRYQSTQNTEHYSLRRLAVSHIRSRPNDYQGFIGNNSNLYLSNLAREGEWAGEPEIRALADALNITIIVIRPHGQSALTYGTNTTITIHIGFNGINHYVSLLPSLQEQNSFSAAPLPQLSVQQNHSTNSNNRQATQIQLALPSSTANLVRQAQTQLGQPSSNSLPPPPNSTQNSILPPKKN